MSRVVLFYPDLFDARRPGRFHDRQILPVSVLAVATALARDGFETAIIDQRVDPLWKEHLEAALRGDAVFLGVSSMTGVQIRGGLEASRIAREVRPDLPVVWGGVHPSLLPEETLGHPAIDIAVIGEGEETAPALARVLQGGEDPAEIPGTASRRDGRIRHGPPRPLLELDRLPPLGYGLMGNLDPYRVRAFYSGRPSLAYQSSRGCAHFCAYCYNLRYNERRFRALPAERVVDEMAEMVGRYELGGVFLLDDNFFQGRHRVQEICEGILKRGLGIELYNANCRIDYIAAYDLEFLALLARAGIRELRIGIESGSDSLQGKIDKHLTFEGCLEANRKLRASGIVPHYNFMIGFPGEDRADIEATLRLMVRLLDANPKAFVYNCSLFSPYPGTPLYERSVRAGWHPPRRLEDWVRAEFQDLNAAASPGRSKYLRDVHEFSAYLDPKHRGGLGRVYSTIARLRVRKGWMGVLFEARLRRWVRAGMGGLRRRLASLRSPA